MLANRAIFVGLATGILVSFISSGTALAEPAKKEAAVRQLVDAYISAWNEGDVERMAGLWSDDGLYIDEFGEHQAAERRDQSAGKEAENESRPSLAIETESIRMVADDVALIDGREIMTFANPDRVRRGRFAAVVVLRGERWLIHQVRQLGRFSEQSHHGMEEMEWLVGNWIGLSGTSKSHKRADWTENKRFITRHFEVMDGQKVTLVGTQKIGWDPHSRQIKSWYFDSSGSVGEGMWERHGDHWIVTINGVLEDGRRVTGTNIYTPIDKDSYLQQSLHMRIGGHAMPDHEMRVVRTKQDQ